MTHDPAQRQKAVVIGSGLGGSVATLRLAETCIPVTRGCTATSQWQQSSDHFMRFYVSTVTPGETDP